MISLSFQLFLANRVELKNGRGAMEQKYLSAVQRNQPHGIKTEK